MRSRGFLRVSLLTGAIMAMPALAWADATATIEGSAYKVIEIAPDNNTGLNRIFVVRDTKECTLSFKASDGYKATVYRYSNLGGGYAEEVTNLDRTSTSVALQLPTQDMGYIFEQGTSRYYCWVTNYANHVMTMRGVSAGEPDCDYSILNFEGDASPINYYTINGQPRVLSRNITIEYTTQEYDEEAHGYKNTDITKTFESLGTRVSITPPAYCSTYFTVTGDRFLKEWNAALTAETSAVNPVAVACVTKAVQAENNSEEASNQVHGDENALGGSAPAEISFYAYTTEGVIHHEWQMSRYQDFDNPDYRFYQQDLDYTFHDEGTYYLRFIGSNADGTCETFGDVITVSIGSSILECPNAFSPNDDGVNDVWKVSYRSLLDFHCEIFNRNGQKIYSFNDPSGGWDGTWNGRKVKSGVYYYVIVATGADGQQYKKSGDINIILSKSFGKTYPDSTPEGDGGDGALTE